MCLPISVQDIRVCYTENGKTSQVFECWRIQNGIRNQEITPLEILLFIGKRDVELWNLYPNHPPLESRKI